MSQSTAIVRRWSAQLLLAAVFVAVCQTAAFTAAPRALPQGTLPDDARLGKLKTLNDYFPFVPQPTPEAWARRAQHVRTQMKVGLGIWPMPTKTPLNAVIHGKVDMGDYTIEKAYFQSYPGHFVTGNLYRPKTAAGKGKAPGVLSPHGHWSNGRFYDQGEKGVQNEIKNGAEKFEVGGRSPLQARCVQLARMGCIVFHYDMIGYADSVQIAHRPGVRRNMFAQFDTQTGEPVVGTWGFFSPQADLRLETMMGVQAYNSIRALDFLLSLPQVDPDRVACTGASGGGTQTFTLSALDPRLKVSFPAVMVSTAMQGGCTCENTHYLRINTGNVEFAAMFAPKPVGMTAANDWTKEMMTKGYPELKQHFTMLGVPDHVKVTAYLQFGHNYNYRSRQVMYEWMNQFLKLGQSSPIQERDYKRLSAAELTVWDKDHPKPAGGDEYEKSLLGWLTKDAAKHMAALRPKDAATLAQYRRVVGGAAEVMLGSAATGDIEWDQKHKVDRGEYFEFAGLLRQADEHKELPAAFLQPKNWNKQVVVWVDGRGKAALFADDGSPSPLARRIIDTGAAVAGVDLLYQGEFLKGGKPLAEAPLVNNGPNAWQQFSGYTYGYNYPLFSRRVQDVLTMIQYVHSYKTPPEKVHLLGLNGAGALAAAAGARAGDAVDRVAVDTGGFRFAHLRAINDPDFLPGGAKYDDLPGLLALCAPHPLWLAGEGEHSPDVTAAAYKAAGAPDAVTTFTGNRDARGAAAVKWLLR